jgi:hypothetical protein
MNSDCRSSTVKEFSEIAAEEPHRDGRIMACELLKIGERYSTAAIIILVCTDRFSRR